MSIFKFIFRVIALTFLLLVAFFSTTVAFVSCDNPTYQVNNVCVDNECYETESASLSSSDSNDKSILKDYNQINLDVENTLNDIIDNYIYEFYWLEYKLSWYCVDDDCDDTETNYYNLSELLSISDDFKVIDKFWQEKRYIDWYNYFLRNYDNVLSYLHKELFGFSSYYSLKSDLSQNVLSVATNANYIKFANVCSNFDCTDTIIDWISINDSNNYKLLEWWDIVDLDLNLNQYTNHKEIESYFSLDKTIAKAWNPVTVWFWFKDILPDYNSCTVKSYKYKIYYRYSTDPADTRDLLLDQEFKIKVQDWTIYWTLDDLNYVNTIKNRDTLEIEVKEPFIITKSWTLYFYVDIIDLDENYTTSSQINYSWFELIAWDPYLPSSTITTNYDITKNWYPLDIFNFNVLLEDTYGNLVDDKNKWLNVHYDINNNYKLASDISSFYNWSLLWVKSSSDKTYNFRFQPTKSWFYEKKYNIDYYKTDDDWNITWEKLNFDLKDNTNDGSIFIDSTWWNNDFNVACTKNNITLTAICTSDNFSWCDPTYNQTKLISTNGESWVLTIRDYAGNQKSFSYNINHIDKSSPVLNIDWYEFGWNYSIKASDDINLIVSDDTAPECKLDNYLKYKIYDKNNTTHIFQQWQTEAWDYNNTLIELNLKETWLKNFVFEVQDKYWNITIEEITFNVYPWDLDASKTELLVSSNWDRFANNSDFYEYEISLKDKYWNPIYSKELTLINQDCTWITWCLTIKTDMTNPSYPTGSDALTEEWSWLTDLNWKINFKLKSYTPGEFSQSFKIEMNKWNNNYQDISEKTSITKSISSPLVNSFKKPFIADLDVSNDDWDTWDWSISLWTSLKYKLNVLAISSLNNFSIEYFTNFIKAKDESSHSISNLTNPSPLVNNNPIFEATINTSTGAESLWTNIWIKIEPNPVIRYNLAWKITKYRLTEVENDYNNLIPLSIENNNSFLWVQIIWSLQWEWKQVITWQESNFSDISKTELRTQIRQNAYKYISLMSNWQIVNWVKYVEWDITISWNQDYETLVVKDWNVIIDWDLNMSNSKLWIIVLKDWYNTNTWYTWKWNVFVKPHVRHINVIIYADWALISADNNWNVYDSDTSERTYELRKQLIMNWTLFTRNTIWWAILAWWYYTLPWWSKLEPTQDNFNKAMLYDLNYLRRWKDMCEEISSWVCKYDNWAFVIIYNSTVQNDFPKLFWQ